MATFSENLAGLPLLDNLQRLEILDGAGTCLFILENKPGTQGSFRIYHFVANKWGGLTAEAAREALELYAEHTEDARQHPGKHPNIDRLFEIRDKNLQLVLKSA